MYLNFEVQQVTRYEVLRSLSLQVYNPNAPTGIKPYLACKILVVHRKILDGHLTVLVG